MGYRLNIKWNMDNWNQQNETMKEPRKEDVLTIEYLTNIARDQDNIFLSSTMTGNLQLLRLEHIGYFRYNSGNRQWEAVLCNHRSLALKRTTNAEKILSYHPHLVQISQSFIVNVSYLILIKGNNCIMLPPFDKMEVLQISKSCMKKLMEKYPNI